MVKEAMPQSLLNRMTHVSSIYMLVGLCDLHTQSTVYLSAGNVSIYIYYSGFQKNSP